MQSSLKSLMHRRTFASFFFTVFLSSASSANSATLASHVDDPVKYLGANRASIERKLAALEKETGYQVVLQTRRETAYDTVEEFGLNEFRQLKLGTQGKDNGALLLIITDYKNLHIEAGSVLEDVLHNPAADKAIRDAIAIRSDAETGGIVAERGVDAVISLLQPSLWYLITHPRTLWSALPLLLLYVGFVITIIFGIKKYKSSRGV
jgi:uncharacterized protein